VRELTARLRDFLPDILDRFGRTPAALPVPPASLRRNVGRTSSRDEYLEGGAGAVVDILEAFHGCRVPGLAYPQWLDFGCGCARMTRYLSRVPDCAHVIGVDVDAKAIRWCKQALPFADFEVISPEPPLPFENASINVAFAASVFTHLPEQQQFLWLAEFARVLAPGGMLIASTHAPHLAPSRPDLRDSQCRALEQQGFAFAPGESFNGATAFHSRAYLEREWGRYFALRSYRDRGLFQYQDLAVWQAPPNASLQWTRLARR
jgi:SAM-dependent methyltransferase